MPFAGFPNISCVQWCITCHFTSIILKEKAGSVSSCAALTCTHEKANQKSTQTSHDDIAGLQVCGNAVADLQARQNDKAATVFTCCSHSDYREVFLCKTVYAISFRGLPFQDMRLPTWSCSGKRSCHAGMKQIQDSDSKFQPACTSVVSLTSVLPLAT